MPAAGDQSGTQSDGRCRRGISSVETGISLARQVQKSWARLSSWSACKGAAHASAATKTNIGRQRIMAFFLALQCVSLRGLRIFERIIQVLVCFRGAPLYNSPAIIIVTECNARPEFHASLRKRSAHFVHRDPFPGEVYVRPIAVLRDASNADQLPLRGRNGEILVRSALSRDQITKCFHADGGKSHVPARWRRNFPGAGSGHPGNPAATLENQVLRAGVVHVGNEPRAQKELLRSFEACRVPNFLGSAPAGKKVAGTAAY